MNRPTLLFQLNVEPIAGSSAAEEASGGIANVWVRAEQEAEGFKVAQEELNAAGWRVLGHEEPFRTVTQDDFAPGSLGRERFDQTQEDEVVIQLHTWRAEH